MLPSFQDFCMKWCWWCFHISSYISLDILVVGN